MQITVKCRYSSECASCNTNKCQKCTNNKMRNYVKDYFESANDKPISQCRKNVRRCIIQGRQSRQRGTVALYAADSLTRISWQIKIVVRIADTD